MNKWEHVRKAAFEFRSSICAAESTHIDAIASAELVRLAATKLGLTLRPVQPGHPDLPVGVDARVEDESIYFRNDVDEWLAIYFQAHEIGHVVLRHGSRECSEAEIDPEATETNAPFGVHRVQGYSPRERIECEANIFAREFLLPAEVLRSKFIDEGKMANQIAAETGMNIEVVIHQLAFALLTPSMLDSRSPDEDEMELILNDSQRAAAEIKTGPQLVDAGPGTGKTRTLVGRVLHLIRKDVNPENILVLTFSNKATEELRSRIHKFAPDAAGSVTIETFHSFGLELLRKYGIQIGLKEDVEVVDPVEVVFLLEKALPKLGLEYFEYLPEPSKNLPDIAKAISRSKDENVGPETYLELAKAQRMTASDESDVEKAEKILEVARVYKIYTDLLAEKKAADLGDLICRSIELLKNHADVQMAVRERYQHVLVDEYQDVNRASGLFLKELVGEGKGLWAVGDLRQSIHRWRGATTANIRQFEKDYPLAKGPLSLAKNYRSRRSIVDLVSAFAGTMQANRPGHQNMWEIHREDEGRTISFNAASDPEAESFGIASEIKKLKENGFAFGDQAVICRTHKELTRVATVLNDAGVPVLYIGDLFERPEIRDLLALLSLATGPGGSGLVRVARFPEYAIPFDDVKALTTASSEQSVTFPTALVKAQEIERISADGRQKLKLLDEHLKDLTYGRSAWKCLTRYLFERSNWLQPLLLDRTISGQQQRLAVYQFLQFIHSRLKTDPGGKFPVRSLLEYIRRLEILGDEKQLREPDEWARGLDAVRLMTIHASKGLEFRVVFLPGLSKGNIPNSYGRSTFPIPVGLVSETNPEWRMEEEECLFFVAMSRAKERLYLSRPVMKNGKKSNPSDFLANISAVLAHTSDPTWTAKPDRNQSKSFVFLLPSHKPRFRPNQLDLYKKCPLSYFYQYVLGLSGRTEDTAFLEFHQAVHRTVRKLAGERAAGKQINDELVDVIFEQEWQESGPDAEHYLESLYKDAAIQMVNNAVERMRASTGTLITEYELELDGGTVNIEFDHAELENAGKGPVRIQRFRTGRRTQSENKKEIYGLLCMAAGELSGGADFHVETLYLRDNSVDAISITEKDVQKRVDFYKNSMKNIADGLFPPDPDDFRCPRCAHYFTCPAAN